MFFEVFHPGWLCKIKKEVTGMDFGRAIDGMREGLKMRRAGWNGKGMWVALQEPDAGSMNTLPYIYIEYPVGHVAYPNGSRVPWLASQTDMLANDWEVHT